jgi:hypothetical protein
MLIAVSSFGERLRRVSSSPPRRRPILSGTSSPPAACTGWLYNSSDHDNLIDQSDLLYTKEKGMSVVQTSPAHRRNRMNSSLGGRNWESRSASERRH